MAQLTFEDYKSKPGKRTNDYKTITGNVYVLINSIFHWNQEIFLINLGMQQDVASMLKMDSHRSTQIFRGDYYGDYSNHINLGSFYDQLKNKLYINNFDHEIQNEINEKVICTLDDSQLYLAVNQRADKWTEDSFREYDEGAKVKLFQYYDIKRNNYDLAYNIYLLMYFAIYKRLPDKFYFGVNYERELEQFNKEVTSMYGVTSRPAVRAILALADAERPNSIAVFEKGEMYYYGNPNGIERNIIKAYETYEIAAGLSPNPAMTHPEGNDNSFCHPLAFWVLGYILFNYHRENTDLENCKNIPKIDSVFGNNELCRVEQALIYAKRAQDLIDDGPAANLLGKIALLTDKELPGISEIKKKHGLKESHEYFEFSARHNYVYAINNLAMEENEKIFTDSLNQKVHLANLIEWLDRSAQQYEPWACNMLGELYRTGIVEQRSWVVGKKSGEKRLFREIVDKEKAYAYYLRAVTYFINRNSAWSFCNLLIYYSDKYKANINLVREYVHEVSRLKHKEVINILQKKLPEIYGYTYEQILEPYEE